MREFGFRGVGDEEESEGDDGGMVKRAIRYHYECGECGHREDASVLAVMNPGRRTHEAVMISGREAGMECPACGVLSPVWKMSGAESYEPEGMVVW